MFLSARSRADASRRRAVGAALHRVKRKRTAIMKETKPVADSRNDSEMTSLLLGAGFALASLIILPALAQRVGLGSTLTIALRGALMRASNRV
jgi:hypothetical protein